jgi:hypothetical protein
MVETPNVDSRMNRLSRSFGAVVFGVTLLAGCTTGPGEGGSQSRSESMPPNYRALIAQYILSREPFDKKQLSTAQISKPYAKWGGLLGDPPIPTVCVSLDTCNMLGMCGVGYLQFTVTNGQIRRLKSSNAIFSSECGTFSTFHEVMKR